jgi:hypothetical protein
MRNLPNRSTPRAPRWTGGYWDEWSRRIWRYSRTTELPFRASAHGVHQSRSTKENEEGHDHTGKEGCVASTVGIGDQCERNRDCRHENQETNDQCRHPTIDEIAMHAQVRRRMTARKNPRRDSGVDSSEENRPGEGCPGGSVLRQNSEHDPSCGEADPIPRGQINFGDHLLAPLRNRVQRKSSLCFCDFVIHVAPLTFLLGKCITFQVGKSTDLNWSPPARPPRGLPDRRGKWRGPGRHSRPAIPGPVGRPERSGASPSPAPVVRCHG